MVKAIEANPESFDPFGQVIEASADGLEFGPADAQLQLHRGTPRCPFHLSLPHSLSCQSGYLFVRHASCLNFDVGCG